MTAYTDRFDDAMVFAHQLHQAQQRKGSGVPYITHLLGVAALVGDYGGSEDQVIAALLHDALEDQSEHYPNLQQEIASRYGVDVEQMVLHLSDTVITPKPPWKKRKLTYIQHIIDAEPDDPSLLVSACDKLYNAQTILRDMRWTGMDVFSRFKATPDQTLWYYQSLAEAFLTKTFGSELQRQVSVTLDHTVTLMAQALDEQA